MSLTTEREMTAKTKPVTRFDGRVSFSRVSFRYTAEGDPALVGTSFTVEPGEVCVIAGANASGKSTVFKLLIGLYQPQAGSIAIDNHDIRQLDPDRASPSDRVFAAIGRFVPRHHRPKPPARQFGGDRR